MLLLLLSRVDVATASTVIIFIAPDTRVPTLVSREERRVGIDRVRS